MKLVVAIRGAIRKFRRERAARRLNAMAALRGLPPMTPEQWASAGQRAVDALLVAGADLEDIACGFVRLGQTVTLTAENHSSFRCKACGMFTGTPISPCSRCGAIEPFALHRSRIERRIDVGYGMRESCFWGAPQRDPIIEIYSAFVEAERRRS